MASGWKSKKVLMGSNELTRLWNLCPDNLEACKADNRVFLPTLEEYFSEAIEQADPAAMVEEEYKYGCPLKFSRRYVFTAFNSAGLQKTVTLVGEHCVSSLVEAITFSSQAPTRSKRFQTTLKVLYNNLRKNYRLSHERQLKD
ncbi:hypothetical protein pdam_00023130 [Pocillopora damicornis]|uniref:Uncharacterized protein n=1 Tax=Pocillopora damicornis TaxID=46731 RepID=A0A3M6UJ69_POCDA|nr:hypothetical protein pdam_00023130 [Pocillopora damicornis]